jgi:hypothetical protein
MKIRKQLMVVAALAALGVAGCGGGDSNKTLSYSDFGKKADEICSSETPKIKATGAKLSGDAKKDAPVYDELLPELKAANDKFKALKPPDELKPDFEKATSIQDQQYALTQEAQKAAKSGDQAAYQAVLKQFKPLSEQSNLAASKLGAATCAKS